MNPAQSIEKKLSPILIVDKDGLIGEALIKKLKEEALIIFISERQPEELDKDQENIIFIPFKSRPSSIPDNIYSYIFVVDDTVSWIRSSLAEFAKKADYDKTGFIFISDLNKKNDDLNENIGRFHRAKILILGDIFNEEDLTFRTLSNKFINQAREEGRVDVSGEGAETFYPVSFRDSIEGIVNSVFSDDKTAVNYVFARHPFSHLAFAHAIQKENPHIKIDFVKKDKETSETVLNEAGRFIFGDNYSLKDRIKTVKLSVLKKEREEKITTIVSYEEEKKKRHIFLKAVGFILLLILFPAILTFSSSFIGLKALEASKETLAKGNLSQAADYSSFAEKQFVQASFFSKPLLFELEALGLLGKSQSLFEKIELGQTIAKTETVILRSIILITSNSPDTKNLPSLINEAKSSLESYSKQTALSQTNFINDPKYEKLLSFASATVGVWNDLFGLNGKRKYLILFQNNMELRPGGGFIGSYAVLTLDKGKVSEFKIHDVYDADGQLKGHVEPPFAIRRYLGKVHWYLRDSNYDINFPKGAASAAYFLNLEMGEKVNGVIAIDVSFIKNLIEAIGSIYVADYKETVNADNVFYLAESHAEKDFFPGSSQKKDFLRSLSNEIQFKITKDKKVPFLPVLTAVEKSLAEKHLLFAFDDQSIQSIFSVNNWSSAVPSQVSKNGDVVDFVGLNEENLGINKTNYFIQRSVSKTVTVDETGKIASTLSISYKNTSDGKWPGGDYKNYLRVILPEGTEIESIEIDGKKQETVPAITNFIQYESKTFKPPTGLEVEKYTQDKKTIYGFLTIIPAGKIKTIKINYSLAEKISTSQAENNYTFYFYKQPGTDNFPVNLSVNLAKNFKFITVPKGFSKVNNQITTGFSAIGDIYQDIKINRN